MALTDSYVRKGFEPGNELEEERKAALLDEMGITQYDVDKLKAMQLGADEAVCAKREELERIRQHKGRKDQWEEFVDVKRRMGRVLHHSEIISRLKRIVPSLIVARGGQLNRIGLYIVRNTPVDEIPGYPLAARTKHVDVPIYVGWMDLGYSPEYEIDLVNDASVAVAQRRGWRTLLLRLIARRLAPTPGERLGRPMPLITEEQAQEVFGHPTNGATASNYRHLLWQFRNGIK